MAAVIQNTAFRAGGKYTTADATPVVAAQFTATANKAYFVDAKVVAINQDGTQAATYWLQACFLCDSAGTCTQPGSTRTIATANESNAAWDCTLANSSAVIGVTVTGAAATNINWRVFWEIVECSVSTPA